MQCRHAFHSTHCIQHKNWGLFISLFKSLHKIIIIMLFSAFCIMNWPHKIRIMMFNFLPLVGNQSRLGIVSPVEFLLQLRVFGQVWRAVTPHSNSQFYNLKTDVGFNFLLRWQWPTQRGNLELINETVAQIAWGEKAYHFNCIRGLVSLHKNEVWKLANWVGTAIIQIALFS